MMGQSWVGGVWVAALLAVSLCAPPAVCAQRDAPPPEIALPDRLPPPRPDPETTAAPREATVSGAGKMAGEASPMAVGMTLQDALRVSALSNLNINIARQVVEQALAGRQRAWVMALPDLTGGANYIHHDGRFQQTAGNIIDVNRDSLFVGGGPTLTVALADALFAPGIAGQVVRGAEAGQRRATNDNLLATAEAYLAVLRARRRVARIAEVLEFLTSDRKVPLRSNALGLLPLARAFTESGAMSRANLERVEVEVLRRQEEMITALQDLRLAIAELARVLHLDPTVILWPLEDFRVPVPVAGEAWAELDTVDLAAEAIANRPEIAENQALTQAALARVRTAIYRPLVPSLIASYSAGGFGGGPALLPGSTTLFTDSGRITRFGNRDDFDVRLMWRLQNMGFGNLADQREMRSLHQQAILRTLQTQDRVVADVVQAQEQVLRTRELLGVSRRALYTDAGKPNGPGFRSVELNFLRIQLGGASPLEVLDSIRSLGDLIDTYNNAMTDFERARFRMLVALGMPPEGLVDPRLLPQPPCKPAALPPSAAAPPAVGEPAPRDTHLPAPRPAAAPPQPATVRPTSPAP